MYFRGKNHAPLALLKFKQDCSVIVKYATSVTTGHLFGKTWLRV